MDKILFTCAYARASENKFRERVQFKPPNQIISISNVPKMQFVRLTTRILIGVFDEKNAERLLQFKILW